MRTQKILVLLAACFLATFAKSDTMTATKQLIPQNENLVQDSSCEIDPKLGDTFSPWKIDAGEVLCEESNAPGVVGAHRGKCNDGDGCMISQVIDLELMSELIDSGKLALRVGAFLGSGQDATTKEMTPEEKAVSEKLAASKAMPPPAMSKDRQMHQQGMAKMAAAPASTAVDLSKFANTEALIGLAFLDKDSNDFQYSNPFGAGSDTNVLHPYAQHLCVPPTTRQVVMYLRLGYGVYFDQISLMIRDVTTPAYTPIVPALGEELLLNPSAELDEFDLACDPQAWVVTLGSPARTNDDWRHLRSRYGFIGSYGPVAEMHQLVDLTAFTALIDGGKAAATLEAWVGGFEGEYDQAYVRIELFNDKEMTKSLPDSDQYFDPVTPEERNGLSAYIRRIAQFCIPKGAYYAKITLTFQHQSTMGHVGGATKVEAAEAVKKAAEAAKMEESKKAAEAKGAFPVALSSGTTVNDAGVDTMSFVIRETMVLPSPQINSNVLLDSKADHPLTDVDGCSGVWDPKALGRNQQQQWTGGYTSQIVDLNSFAAELDADDVEMTISAKMGGQDWNDPTFGIWVGLYTDLTWSTQIGSDY